MLNNFKLTQDDIDNLTEGVKKRPEHIFKSLPKLSNHDQLIDHIISNNGNIDARTVAKEFGKTSTEINDLLKHLGYYS